MPAVCSKCGAIYGAWPGECQICGGKSHRVTPVAAPFEELLMKQRFLMTKVPHGHIIKPEHMGSVVASLGIIEEVLEYLNAIGFKSWRPDPLPREKQLEEISDVLFFYLEMVVFSGFEWHEITQEYHRKYEVNLERWKKLMVGDTSWDDRGKKEGL